MVLDGESIDSGGDARGHLDDLAGEVTDEVQDVDPVVHERAAADDTGVRNPGRREFGRAGVARVRPNTVECAKPSGGDRFPHGLDGGEETVIEAAMEGPSRAPRSLDHAPRRSRIGRQRFLAKHGESRSQRREN